MLRKVKSSKAHELVNSLVKRAPLCVFSGILLSIPFWNGNFWIFAWCGMAPLFFALEGRSRAQRFLLGYLCGVVFWWATIFWLVHVTFIGTAVLILYLALYFGIFGVLLPVRNPKPAFTFLLVPSAWVILEYVRSHLLTGFPWALLGYSQYLNLPVIQIADVTGVWGVSFLVMMGNAALYSVIGYRLAASGERLAQRGIRNQGVATLLCILLAVLYGYHKLNRMPHAKNPTPLKISVIQGNIPQDFKWTPQYNDFIIKQYLTLTKKASVGIPDLILWPEAALPVVPEEEPAYYEMAVKSAQETRCNLLFGAVTKRDSLYYNSAILISPQGSMRARYDKIHLVPFGEYIPLRNTLPFLQTFVPIGDMTAGKEYTVFTPSLKLKTLNPVHFSVLICFEDLFPELSRQFVKKGADFLVNITNDAWYKKGPASMQHLQASVFRAVENRVQVVRAANTGISAFIDPSGKIISKVCDKGGRMIFVEGYDTQVIALTHNVPTAYNRFGDACIVLCALAIAGGITRGLSVTVR